jgi:hypothetical protein
MSESLTIKFDYEDLKRAIDRSPEKVKEATSTFLARGRHYIMGTVNSAPWRMGDKSGGSPVALMNGGNLRTAHEETMSPWQWKVQVNEGKAPYAPYVHGIDGYSRKRSYQLRPWLDHALDVNSKKIEQAQDVMIETIVQDLAK